MMFVVFADRLEPVLRGMIDTVNVPNTTPCPHGTSVTVLTLSNTIVNLKIQGTLWIQEDDQDRTWLQQIANCQGMEKPALPWTPLLPLPYFLRSYTVENENMARLKIIHLHYRNNPGSFQPFFFFDRPS